ncbi:hypothetical protein GGS23DRAFT_44059 [Durotheca rogersii]|uniref:uncharacterized protein n=1 Tax=Durotheca rogersii TaxID=419775 RepID=UPI00221FDFAF|nr:uncharacterized protein GGS23DRAFT_44059 [Durotheca rogersii]KAI5868666.1 hypothetical protein GGS23DRAFT_44059 [Durotheca rogersii]
MDPSAMEFVMHHPDHAGTASSSPNVDHGARSACPALRAAAERNQHSAPRPSFHYDPVHGNAHGFWEAPPSLPHGRWLPDTFQPPGPLPPHTGQFSQSLYTPALGGSSHYNYRYRTPMLSLQRIGGTAPIQHSHGNFSVPSQPQPQAGSGNGVGPGPHVSRNSTLPPLNPMPPQGPPQTATHNLQAPTFMSTARPAQHPGRQSPPPFVRQNSTPSTSLPPAEVVLSSSTSRTGQPRGSHSASSSPPRRLAVGSQAESQGTASETRRRSQISRGPARASPPGSDLSSDEDSDADAVAISFLEAAVSGAGTPMGEDRVRAHQIIRGAASGKRVASRKAITSLESVNIADLPENERTCVICYNDFGVETPEGVNESPLRLPKCKHVFGDHCIKKWFEESDSCPYCRDKVPSEPQYPLGMNSQAIHRFLRHANQMTHMHMRHSRDRERGDVDSSNRSPGMVAGITTLASSAFTDLDYGLGDPTVAGRRGDGASAYNSRAWYGHTGERHSPHSFGASEATEMRRRTRARHSSLRGLPPTRPHFTQSPTNNTPQSQPYPWLGRQNAGHSHGHRHSMSSSNAAARPAFDGSITPFPFQPQIGAPPEPYLNPLNITSGGGVEEYATLPHMRSHYPPPLSPTFGGPEVYMNNSDDNMLGGTGAHQQL